jgi:TonB family protein
MYTVTFSSTLISCSLLSRSMVMSLTLALLAHVTAFAFSYNWDIIAQEKSDQPFLVELLDVPLALDETPAAKPEASERGGHHERNRAEPPPGIKGTSASYPTSLVAQNDYPRASSPELHATTSPPGESEATVSLDSMELKYVSYLSSIKKRIEPRWQYPESAQQMGLQGRLALCFSIARDGQLEKLELLSSSGHSLLDDEALNAVRGAAPYYPLPERLHIFRLNILATFEYKISPYSMSRFSQAVQEERL